MTETTTHYVKEAECKLVHRVTSGAPCEWSRERGATHTLHTDSEWMHHKGAYGGTRPARLLKTRLYVGTDETPDGNIHWEKWIVRHV